MPGVPFLLQPHDFISQGRQDIHKLTGKDQTGTLDHPTKNTRTHACSGDETSATETEGPSSSAWPPWCLSHTFSSFLSPPYLPLQKYQAQGVGRGGGGYCVTAPTPTERRIHQGDVGRLSMTCWSLAGSLAAPETRPGRRKSQSAVQKLLVNYIKTVTLTNTHKHTQAPPVLHAELRNGGEGGKKNKNSALPPLEMRNIIQGPSFLSNTRGCLYSEPCLDKFGSIRRAGKKKKIKGNQSTYNFISGVAAAHFR